MAKEHTLARQVALVTAAGQGLGEAIAKHFASEGATVAVVDRDGAEAERVTGEINASGGKAAAYTCDVSQSAPVNELVKNVVARFDTIDILVNAAGGFHQFAAITDITDEEWDRVITNNLRTTFVCTRAVAGVMIERKKGRSINIASGAGMMPNPFAPTYLPYGAAKAGVIQFTKLLARDIGPHGVTVNAISPGTTLTPRVAKVRDAASIEQIRSRNPMRALVEPIDTAEAALFLASEAARYITGTVVNVTAGNVIF